MSTLEIVLAAFVALSVGVRIWRERFWKARVEQAIADEKRRSDDRAAELQKKLDAAVTATFVRIRDELLGGHPEFADIFTSMSEHESKGVQENLDWFRERVGMMNASMEHAQRRVGEAAALVNNVRTENGLCRMLLERAVMLPPNLPADTRDKFLRNIHSVIEAPMPTHEPGDELWERYVKKYTEAHGDAAAVLNPPAPAPGESP